MVDVQKGLRSVDETRWIFWRRERHTSARIYQYNRYVTSSKQTKPQLLTFSEFLYNKASIVYKAGTVQSCSHGDKQANFRFRRENKVDQPIKRKMRVFFTFESFPSREKLINVCAFCQRQGHTIIILFDTGVEGNYLPHVTFAHERSECEKSHEV